MAKGKGHAGTQVAVGKFLVVRDIRATNACCLDCYLKFASTWFFNAAPLLFIVSWMLPTVWIKPLAKESGSKDTKSGNHPFRLCNTQDLGYGTRKGEIYQSQITRAMQDGRTDDGSFRSDG